MGRGLVFLDNGVGAQLLAFLSKGKKLSHQNDLPILIPINSSCLGFLYKLACLLGELPDWCLTRLVV